MFWCSDKFQVVREFILVDFIYGNQSLNSTIINSYFWIWKKKKSGGGGSELFRELFMLLTNLKRREYWRRVNRMG
jgi:hypothetical protein